MKLGDKYKDFLKTKAEVEFLEGTTASGKTTIGAIKFILKCLDNNKKDHILSALDLGVIEKNIINSELGLKTIFGDNLQYYPNGKGDIRMAHLIIQNKIIYVLGYTDSARWKKALGGQVGCIYIDEINIAHMDYVREAVGRCEYLIATLNPDNPDLLVYKEYINKSRPLKKWEYKTPNEILDYLKEDENENWVHWYFDFYDNLGLTPADIERKKRQYPKGSKIYKNKVLGLRGRATGLIFNLEDRMIINRHTLKEQISNKEIYFEQFVCGVDTSYSQKTNDTIAFVYIGITRDGKLYVLETQTYNNKDLHIPLTPSDIPVRLDVFLTKAKEEWGFTRNVFVDSADSGTILECRKYKLKTGRMYDIIPSYKKVKNIDRCNMQNGWMADGKFFIVEDNKDYINECNTYSWKEDKDEPEDANDHTIQACEYAWIPFRAKIGVETNGIKY